MSRSKWSKIQDYARRHWALMAIIVLYLVLAGLYMWVMPPFEGPDEPQHLAYIEWLAEGKGFPPQGDAAWDTPIEQEAGQSPFYYILASLPARLIDLSSPRAEYRPNPYSFTSVPEDPLADNDNRAVHYPGEVQPLAGGWLAIYLARVVTVSFGILLLVSTYGLARQVAPNEPRVAVASAFLAAVIPQVIFISSVASNDIPAAALSALTLWLLIRTVRLGLSGGRALGIGLAYGMAILTKSSAAALGLAIAGALAWFWLSRRESLWRTFRSGLWLALGALLTSGWWLIRSWILYRSPLGLSTHDQTPWAISDPEAMALIWRRWLDVFRSFWLALGWGTIRPKGEWLYIIFGGLALVALAGLAIALVNGAKRPGRRPWVRPISIVVLLLAIIAVAVSLEMWMHRVIAPHGRLMFPALAGIIVLLTVGWYTLDRRVPFIVNGAIMLVAVLSLFLLARPAYSRPQALSPEEVEQLTSRIDVRFGSDPEEPLAILLSANAEQRSVPAKGYLPLELCWLPLRQTETPITILVHIVGPENSVVTGRRTFPGLGRLPTTIWQPGEAFCDQVNVANQEDLPETLVYQIEVAMLDSEAEQRVPALSADGQPMPGIFVGRVRLVSANEPVSVIGDQDGGERIQLVDSSFAAEWDAGETSMLTLEWVTHEELARDYHVYVHLLDKVSGAIVAQADGPPLGGWYPTSFWPAGQIMVDQRDFPVPADLQAGSYDLVVGLYDLESLEQVSKPYFLGSVRIGP
jgi:hypothetical protein